MSLAFLALVCSNVAIWPFSFFSSSSKEPWVVFSCICSFSSWPSFCFTVSWVLECCCVTEFSCTSNFFSACNFRTQLIPQYNWVKNQLFNCQIVFWNGSYLFELLRLPLIIIHCLCSCLNILEKFLFGLLIGLILKLKKDLSQQGPLKRIQ